MQFSLVVPVGNEAELLRRALPSWYRCGASEIVLCFDKPSPKRCIAIAEYVASKNRNVATRLLEVTYNPSFLFHQAWVRRCGFRTATYDVIVTCDVDDILTRNVQKAASLVGSNGVGLASCSKFYYPIGLRRLWRAIGVQLIRLQKRIKQGGRLRHDLFTGVYAFYRPFWLETERGIEKLPNPKNEVAGAVTMGEDTHLRNSMVRKYKAVYLSDIGSICLRDQHEDDPHVQFQTGMWLMERGRRFRQVLLSSILLYRFRYLKGFLYERNQRARSRTRRGSRHFIFLQLFDYVRARRWTLSQSASFALFIAIRTVLRVLIGKERRDREGWVEACHDGGLSWRGYEPSVSQVLDRLHGSVFLDIGASRGQYSFPLSKRFKTVYAFEPFGENIRWLKSRKRRLKRDNVSIVEAAVSDRSGVASLNLDPLNLYGGGSVLGKSERQMPVSTVALDDVFGSLPQPIDLVKVDVEGAEWLVLRGAKAIMPKIQRWCIELHDPSKKEELERLLTGLGYSCRWLDSDRFPHIFAWRTLQQKG